MIYCLDTIYCLDMMPEYDTLSGYNILSGYDLLSGYDILLCHNNPTNIGKETSTQNNYANEASIYLGTRGYTLEGSPS